MSTQFDCLRDAGRAGSSALLQNRFCLKSKPLGEKDNANLLRLTCIADRQHFRLMTIWFVPVDDATAVLRIDSEKSTGP